MTILVVVRDPDVRALIKTMLKTAHWQVLGASSEAEAADVAARCAVDLLIAEVAPTFDGRRLAQRLRERAPQLPVLYVTGWYDDAEFAAAKGETVLAEPFSRDELMSAIAAVFTVERRS